MPLRQDTFELVPVNTTAPRPPMTSKAAKKAYRAAAKVPKISKAEQRRIEAAEIARQKKEREMEKATARTRAAREKKMKKEAEERDKRKKLGLPEPSRFVRPGQLTIKKFVKSGVEGKRSWEEIDGMVEEDTKSINEEQRLQDSENGIEPPVKKSALNREDDDDGYGDFPSLSQVDLPNVFVNLETCQKQPDSSSTTRTVSFEPIPGQSNNSLPASRSHQPGSLDCARTPTGTEFCTEVGEGRLLTESMLTRTDTSRVQQRLSSMILPKSVSGLSPGMPVNSKTPPVAISAPLIAKDVSTTDRMNGSSMLSVEVPRVMPPLALPPTVNELGSRKLLVEISKNIRPSALPPGSKAVMSTSKFSSQALARSERRRLAVPPPSTLAFLEAYLDDFYPSPSQQARELLEDIDDIPSNTQIAREIELEHGDTAIRTSLTPAPSSSASKFQFQTDYEALHFLSSQDLEISSQDLRDIDTPNKALHKGPHPSSSTLAQLVQTQSTHLLPPLPKSKPRFFEEKEDDLLHAALHESRLFAKQTSGRPSLRRSERIFSRAQQPKADYEGDTYGSDGSDLDPELLALLDDDRGQHDRSQ